MFMRELEEDPEMREKINIYKDKSVKKKEKNDDDLEEDVPEIPEYELRDENEVDNVNNDDDIEFEVEKEPILPKGDGKLFTKEELDEI